MSRFPHVRREVPTSQVVTVTEEVELRGLDGHGTTHAADLPTSAHVWGHLAAPSELGTDVSEEEPVKREKCLLVDPDGDYLMPGRCKRPIDHEGDHDWLAAHGAYLDRSTPLGISTFAHQERAQALDTPSGVLPRRTPGAALGDAEAESGAAHAENAARGSESILGHPIIERWPA